MRSAPIIVTTLLALALMGVGVKIFPIPSPTWMDGSLSGA